MTAGTMSVVLGVVALLALAAFRLGPSWESPQTPLLTGERAGQGPIRPEGIPKSAPVPAPEVPPSVPAPPDPAPAQKPTPRKVTPPPEAPVPDAAPVEPQPEARLEEPAPTAPSYLITLASKPAGVEIQLAKTGQMLGRTPCQVQLPAGSHAVRFVAPGRGSVEHALLIGKDYPDRYVWHLDEDRLEAGY